MKVGDKAFKIFCGGMSPGFHAQLPIKAGDVVTIVKGTPIKHRAEQHIAQKTYKVKVHHILSGVTYTDFDRVYAQRHGKTCQDQNPSICWAGTGGYWSEVDINLIPEVVQS